MRSAAGTPTGTVVLRGARTHRIVGRAILVNGGAKVRIGAGHRALVRHFVATYIGNTKYAASTSNRVWLVVVRRATQPPAALPNTGARSAFDRMLSR